MLSNTERVKYYMGRWYEGEFKVDMNKFDVGNIKGDTTHDIPFIFNNDTKLIKTYHTDFNKIRDSNQSYLFQNGDQPNYTKEPILIKSRSKKLDGIILKLNVARHWIFWNEVNKNDIDWHSKKTDVVWRGVSTGYKGSNNKRKAIVEAYHQKYNIGFNRFVQGRNWDEKLLKPTISIKDQLRYKWILSLEGNDVATNLKWILYSNSVPIMFHPTCETWLMEFKLEPFVHYVPIDSVESFEETLKWCRNNDEKCKQIAINGKKWMEQFKDGANETKIQKEILKRYSENVDLVV